MDVVVIHATDMPFFDSRLNIAGWILLAGLRCVILLPQSIDCLGSLPHGDVELRVDA